MDVFYTQTYSRVSAITLGGGFILFWAKFGYVPIDNIFFTGR